ncbi:Uncharacterised protein [Streptococcus pasteurianus]|nr:Uncharacterised protein [Streptococcus pasteurianus]
MNYHQEKKFTDSWFFKWFLNNQAVVAVLITFLVFLTLYLFTKISFLFTPIISFIAIIMLPLVISAILYYLIKPLVGFIEKRYVSRTTSIFIVVAYYHCFVNLGFGELYTNDSRAVNVFR